MKTKSGEVTIVFGPCCFCGRDIESNDIDPCVVTVETAGHQWQNWSIHAACFKKQIVVDGYMDLSPAHF